MYNQGPIWWLLDRHENLTPEHVWDLEYLPEAFQLWQEE